MTKLFTKLSDGFDVTAGLLSGYDLGALGTPYNSPSHYDIRAFHSENVTVPRTMLDMNFWNAKSFDGTPMDALEDRVSTQGRTFRARFISEVEALFGVELEASSMSELDTVILDVGNEGFDPGLVMKKSTERYMDMLEVVLFPHVGVEALSYYSDDLLAGLEDAGLDYFIEFPISWTGGTLDVSLSSITFANEPNLDAVVTDTFTFDQSLVNVATAGYFSIPRSWLTHIDLHNLASVKFTFVADPASTVTVHVKAMRVVPNNYGFPPLAVDTKRGRLSRSVPRDGVTEPSSPMGTLFFNKSRPKNLTEYIKFNSGHNPIGNDNIITFYTRYVDANNWISVQLAARSTQSRLTITQRQAGVSTTLVQTPINTNILTEETEYFLVCEVSDSQVSAHISPAKTVFIPNTTTYTTGWQTTTVTDRGYVGFDFRPYNYDFTIDFIRPFVAEFGSLVEKPFVSIAPVIGAALSVTASPAYDILGDESFVAAGDASSQANTVTGVPLPSTQVDRYGNEWYGGYESAEIVDVTHGRLTSITGDIYPLGATIGKFRVALLDGSDSVAFLCNIDNIVINQWNHFDIPLRSTIAPNGYRLLVHHITFGDPYSFLVDNLAIKTDAVKWEASNDTVNFVPFYDTINTLYGGVNFGTADRQLQIRARMYSDTARIFGFEATPRYGYIGHRPVTLTPVSTSRSQDFRLTGRNTSNTARDFRITGA